METSDDLKQFKEKAQKSESVYNAATDVVISRFMIEVYWAPMLAAFSVPLDQSDDEVVIALCLEGIHCAIHVIAVMSMKTHRDAFVTSLAKFTSLHSPADIKQKNIDAIKAIVTIADERWELFARSLGTYFDMWKEDGVRVMRVENVDNPYKNQPNFDRRFKLTLTKFYVWKLVEYEWVVMLDADNIFLRKPDELFQCGRLCAVFINPYIFHASLFVLQPSLEVFKDMLHQLEIGKENLDGADRGFIRGYFLDLLDMPMFHPPLNKITVNRLPLGYQMDATYYCESNKNSQLIKFLCFQQLLSILQHICTNLIDNDVKS